MRAVSSCGLLFCKDLESFQCEISMLRKIEPTISFSSIKYRIIVSQTQHDTMVSADGCDDRIQPL